MKLLTEEELDDYSNYYWGAITNGTPPSVMAVVAQARLVPKLVEACVNLRTAQKNYMADRGNNEKGKLVAKAAQEMDEALKLVEEKG